MRPLFLFFLSILFFNFQALALNLKCNPTQLGSIQKSEIIANSNSVTFKARFDRAHAAQEKAIEAYGSNSEARTKYLNVDPRGIKSEANLQKIKAKFRYDGISKYLFDDSDYNPDIEFYTSIIKRGTQRFYLNGDNVIAILSVSPDASKILTRYNKECKIKELVSFETLEPTESPVAYKINPNYCTRTANGEIPLGDKLLNELNVYMSLPSSENDKRKYRSDIQAKCRSMVGDPPAARTAVPKSTPAVPAVR